jgi:hypothetical protein
MVSTILSTHYYLSATSREQLFNNLKINNNINKRVSVI